MLKTTSSMAAGEQSITLLCRGILTFGGDYFICEGRSLLKLCGIFQLGLNLFARPVKSVVDNNINEQMTKWQFDIDKVVILDNKVKARYDELLLKNFIEKTIEELNQLCETEYNPGFRNTIFGKELNTHCTQIIPLDIMHNAYNRRTAYPYDTSVGDKYALSGYVNASCINFGCFTWIVCEYPREKCNEQFCELLNKSDPGLVLALHLIEETPYNDYIKKVSGKETKIKEVSRTITKILNLGNPKKQIDLVQWMGWDDSEAPDVVEFEKLYNYVTERMKKSDKTTFIIYSNYGIGRTGTFLMYMALKMMNKNIEFEDYAKVFLWLRACRMGMVKTYKQHLFLIKTFLNSKKNLFV